MSRSRKYRLSDKKNKLQASAPQSFQSYSSPGQWWTIHTVLPWATADARVRHLTGHSTVGSFRCTGSTRVSGQPLVRVYAKFDAPVMVAIIGENPVSVVAGQIYPWHSPPGVTAQTAPKVLSGFPKTEAGFQELMDAVEVEVLGPLAYLSAATEGSLRKAAIKARKKARKEADKVKPNHRPSWVQWAQENPSKAHATIHQAAKESGGWIFKDKQDWKYVVLSGPYVGTYTFTPTNVRWTASFAIPPDKFGKPSFSKTYERMKKLGTLKPKKDGMLDDETIRADMARQEAAQTKAYAKFTAIFQKKINAKIGKLAKAVEAARLKIDLGRGRTPDLLTHTAVALYIMSELAEVAQSRIIKDITEQPKRLLNFQTGVYPALQLPNSQRDRIKFSRKFLYTWSPDQAAKACFPTIEGQPPEMTAMQKPDIIRYAFSGVPSWRQRASEWANARLLHRPATPEASVKMGAAMILSHAETLRDLKMSAKDFKHLLQNFSKDEMGLFVDTMTHADRVRERLGETVEGRRVLQHVANKDWRSVLRSHDFVITVRGGYTPMTKEQAEKFHAGAKDFILPPGVTPLTTEAEFTREGNEMGHCVGMYFWQRKSFCFALQAEDGSRATAELTLKPVPQVVQFFGPNNTTPSVACRALLKHFYNINEDKRVELQLGAKQQVEQELMEEPPEGDDPW